MGHVEHTIFYCSHALTLQLPTLLRLLQRYQNIKNELEAQHKLERINREKHTKRGVNIIIAKKVNREHERGNKRSGI